MNPPTGFSNWLDYVLDRARVPGVLTDIGTIMPDQVRQLARDEVQTLRTENAVLVERLTTARARVDLYLAELEKASHDRRRLINRLDSRMGSEFQ